MLTRNSAEFKFSLTIELDPAELKGGITPYIYTTGKFPKPHNYFIVLFNDGKNNKNRNEKVSSKILHPQKEAFFIDSCL